MRLVGLAMFAALAVSAAHAAPAPERAVCAVEQAIACPPFETCERSLPAAVNLPSLLKIDRPAGLIYSRREAGEERTSKIGSETDGEGFHVLQGVDEGAPWSLLIDLSTGRFTLTSARAEAGYVAFGLCSSRILE